MEEANIYKAALVSKFEQYRRYKQNCLDDIDVFVNEIDANDVKIKHLRGSLTAIKDSVVGVVLNNTIDELVEKNKKHADYVETLTVRVNEYQHMLQALSEVCPHEVTEYSHTNLHKNEDFHRCLLCGSIL